MSKSTFPDDNIDRQNPELRKSKKNQEQTHEHAKFNKTCLNPNCGHSWYAHWRKDHSVACMICFCSKFESFGEDNFLVQHQTWKILYLSFCGPDKRCSPAIYQIFVTSGKNNSIIKHESPCLANTIRYLQATILYLRKAANKHGNTLDSFLSFSFLSIWAHS